MKTIQFILLGGSILGLSSCATEFNIPSDDVPTAVSTTFNTKYPNATGAEWEVEKENGRLIYEAEFSLDGKRKEAEFKPDGTFIKEE